MKRADIKVGERYQLLVGKQRNQIHDRYGPNESTVMVVDTTPAYLVTSTGWGRKTKTGFVVVNGVRHEYRDDYTWTPNDTSFARYRGAMNKGVLVLKYAQWTALPVLTVVPLSHIAITEAEFKQARDEAAKWRAEDRYREEQLNVKRKARIKKTRALEQKLADMSAVAVRAQLNEYRDVATLSQDDYLRLLEAVESLV